MSIRTTTNVTEDEKAAMLKMRNEEGLSVRAIRKRTGRSHSAIRKALSIGAENQGPSVSAVARKQRLERILALRSQGYSYVKIGEALKISGAVVGYHLTKHAKDLNNGARNFLAVAHKKRIPPIVLGAETVAQTDERRFTAVIDTLWSHLPLDQKLRAIESLKVS